MDRNRWTFAFLLLFVSYHSLVDGLWCDRQPHGVNVQKTQGDGGFKIIITGDPETYIPGAVYTVRLQAPGDAYTVDKFSGFLLVAEGQTDSGSFQLTSSDSLARFSEYCSHAVKQASELPKSEVQVRWTAPSVADRGGCVIFRATVVRNKGSWFMDDGQLTKQLCPESEDGQEENESSEPCCACGEAKYELTFEGLWSPLTHPKDFPADTLSAYFSDIVGASHSPSYKFWEYGGEASRGLQSIAENGDSKDLESELKERSGQIRTIIKARGLRNPNFYGIKTAAVFRVDKDNNLISIVSKIVPSPDWFVGISGVNLCLPNCTWKDDKAINLFPWDAGTNDGISYSPAGEPTLIKEPIRRIVWNGDEKSPFYDPSGNIVKPFARLRLSKLRTYDRSCPVDWRNPESITNDYGDDDTRDVDLNKPGCQTTMWSEWSSCSVTCGRGSMTRFRQYVNPPRANELGCNRKLFEKKNCFNAAGCSGSSTNTMGRGRDVLESPGSKYPEYRGNNPCSTSTWGQWSTCSVTCGRGRRTRERRYLQPQLARQSQCEAQLVQHESCSASIPDCSLVQQVQEGCEVTAWSEWGPCSVTCGKGSRARTRLFVNSRISHHKCDLELTQFEVCTGVKPVCNAPEDMKEICRLPMQPGMCPGDGNLTRWHFDLHRLRCQPFQFYLCKGNQNNFGTEKECENACSVLKDSILHEGNGNMNGNGRSYYSQSPSSHYSDPSSRSNNNNNHNNHNNNNWASYQPHGLNNVPVIDCEVSDWSDWSKCSTDCGRGHKARIRYIQVHPQNGGSPCPPLTMTRKCKDVTCIGQPGQQQNMNDPSNNYQYLGQFDYQE